jgi:hypothetical protein
MKTVTVGGYGPNLKFKPTLSTLMFVETATPVIATPQARVVQTNALELLLLKL